MARKTGNFRYDPRAVCQAYFSLAKKWAIAAFLCKLSVFLLGVIAVLLPFLPAYAPFLIAALSATSDFFAWQSDTYKSTAEALLRKLDNWDSFGWAISNSELSDLLLRSPSNLNNLICAEALAESYFASKEGIGVKRALENIQESAWWSKHLSEQMGSYYLVGTSLLILLSVSVLLVSVQSINNLTLLSSIGRIVTSVLLLVFSLGLLRSVLAYYRFSSRAAQVEKYADSLLIGQNLELTDAIKLMGEYHLARASAPLIPTWVWKLKRKELDEVWKKYRQP